MYKGWFSRGVSVCRYLLGVKGFGNCKYSCLTSHYSRSPLILWGLGFGISPSGRRFSERKPAPQRFVYRVQGWGFVEAVRLLAIDMPLKIPQALSKHFYHRAHIAKTLIEPFKEPFKGTLFYLSPKPLNPTHTLF